MRKKKTTSNSGKRKQEKGSAPNGDSQLAAGGELHQIAGGEHPALTTNQGVALSDNQNSLRAIPRGPTLLEDFILREKITHFDHERIPQRIVHARATGVHGFFELTASLKQHTTARILTEVGEKTPTQLIHKESTMSVLSQIRWFLAALLATALVSFALTASAADEDFPTLTNRLQAEKQKFEKRQQALLAERYDLADRPAKGAAMSRGKPVQDGVRVKLPKGMTWEELAALSPEQIKEKQLWPTGFLPLPHPHHEAGGMIFPKFLIEETKKQTDRDVTRFDLDFDLPDHFLPEFPAPIYLTTRMDLGDVSQGKLVTLSNFNELFKDILNPKQLEGLRLLVTPFPQQQFNATEDRRSLKAHQGVACFDCHANGHTNASTHTVGDIRPNEHRHRIDTPSLRGVNVQRLFGSQRALKTVEDFTEFEQRAAYFDGIPADAARKGTNVLERGSQVHFMAEFQALLDFPPAPKLNVFGKLNPAKASENEMRGQQIFFGKGQCATCHTPPYYTDNLMHNLKVERFFKEVTINGRKASADGPIKTFPLRGIKDSPPYLHDDRLLTLEDTVEFFNLVLDLKLNEQEKKDLVAFMRVL